MDFGSIWGRQDGVPVHTGIRPVVSLSEVPWKSLWVTKTAWELRDMMSWAMQMYSAASSCAASPIGCTRTKHCSSIALPIRGEECISISTEASTG